MDINEQIAGLESDCEEIARLLKTCDRPRVRDLLTHEQTKIEKELAQKRQHKLQQDKKDAAGKAEAGLKGYTVKIKNYGWDQSDKFVKIYITLKGVHKIPSENVEATFTESGFNVLVKDLDGKNHQMSVNKLLSEIIVSESSKKIKTDMVLIMCKKKSAKNWECLTQVEKQSKEKEKPNMEPNSDPSEGLMSVLKKIYTDGDDEMKRTINKAWAESQDKKAKPNDFDI